MKHRLKTFWTAWMALLVLLIGASAHAATPTIVTSFDASKIETPENLWIDRDNNIYVTLSFTGEVRIVTPDGFQMPFLQFDLGAPPLTPCFPGSPLPFAAVAGVTGDHVGNLYFGVKSCNPAKSGIWKLSRNGDLSLIFPQGPASLFNGMDYFQGNLYVADSFLDVVWRVDADSINSGAVWSDDPLLKVPPSNPLPGPNGLKVFRGDVYVSVSAMNLIVKLGINRSDVADPAIVHAANAGCDDFSFDVHGALYCGTDPFGTLLKVAADGTVTQLLSVADGLDGPTSSFFGNGRLSKTLFITNGAFPFFSTTHNPTLMSLQLDVEGAP